MRNKFNILALAILGASTLLAQNSDSHMPVTFGVLAGVPVTDMFDANNTTLFTGTTSSTYNAAVPRYELGVSAEFHLPYHLRFEVDGIYKRAGFATQNNSAMGGAATQYYNARFNQFEIPGVFKYNLAMGHYRPFVEVGASMRHIAGITQNSQYTDVPLFYFNSNTPELMNRNSFGGVAGFGFTFKKGPVEISPEARYTRWANESFDAAGLRTNLDQGDVLLGISF
jgi:hypothetical protein